MDAVPRRRMAPLTGYEGEGGVGRVESKETGWWWYTEYTQSHTHTSIRAHTRAQLPRASEGSPGLKTTICTGTCKPSLHETAARVAAPTLCTRRLSLGTRLRAGSSPQEDTSAQLTKSASVARSQRTPAAPPFCWPFQRTATAQVGPPALVRSPHAARGPQAAAARAGIGRAGGGLRAATAAAQQLLLCRVLRGAAGSRHAAVRSLAGPTMPAEGGGCKRAPCADMRYRRYFPLSMC